jgi:serine/threonine protein kinase
MQTQQEARPTEQYELGSPPSFPKELQSRFSQARYLGEGGFARVFSALDLKGAPVAVKVLKSRDPKAGKLFTTEAANWSVLRHENIVRLFDYNIFPIPYLESQLCESSVESEMSYGPLPVERAIELIKQVAYGLSYAHQRRILHGDIKPSNILIKDNTAKISDWGLSKLKTEPSVSVTGVTLQYAAPEQLSREFGGADERTDIYQLGVMLYQCITGRLPFADTGSIVDTILRDAPMPPSQFRQISGKLDDIILKCLKKRKGERYQSAEELVHELDAMAS